MHCVHPALCAESHRDPALVLAPVRAMEPKCASLEMAGKHTHTHTRAMVASIFFS